MCAPWLYGSTWKFGVLVQMECSTNTQNDAITSHATTDRISIQWKLLSSLIFFLSLFRTFWLVCCTEHGAKNKINEHFLLLRRWRRCCRFDRALGVSGGPRDVHARTCRNNNWTIKYLWKRQKLEAKTEKTERKKKNTKNLWAKNGANYYYSLFMWRIKVFYVLRTNGNRVWLWHWLTCWLLSF